MANQTVPAFQLQRPPSLAPDLERKKEKLPGLFIKSWVAEEAEGDEAQEVDSGYGEE